MNEYTDQNLKDFEAALKNKDLSGLNLYSGSNHSNNFCNLNVEEVVTGVAKQIMALQSSDCLLNKKPVQRLNPSIKYPKNAEYSGLSLSNKICKQDKFDTQNVSDTQLINLVQNAEALDDITGLTQVFNTTFCNNTSDSHFEKVKDSSENSNSIKRQSQLPIDNKFIFDKHDSIHEKSLEQEAIDDLNCDGFGLLEEAGRSPILNIIKPISIKRRPTPIAYDLNLFEKFETLAFPIVEEHLDLKVAKKIINSQLLDKKLYIETHSEPVLIERDKSPVFDVKKKKRCRNKNNCNNQFDSIISIIDDEILFSSDEELDKKNDDDKLPLTCLLETSYFTEKVLDETIYVGFQTANNKTIRVKTDSYFKAHDMLKDSDISFINTEEKLTDESIETEDINLSEKKIKQKKCCSFISSNNLVESSKNSTIVKENTVCGSQHTIEIKYEQELDLPLSTKPTCADTIESITKIYPNRNSIDSVENKVQKLNPNQVKIVNNDCFTIDDIIHHEKVVPQSQTLICSSSLEMARNENSVSLLSKKDDLGKLTNTFKIKNNYSEFHPSGTNVNALDCNFVVTNKRKHDMSPKTKNLKKKIKPQNDICEPVNSCYSKTHPKMEKKCNEIYFDDFESSDIIKYENYKAESIKNIHCVTFKLFENSMDEEPYHKANIPTDSKKATSISESTDIYDCDDLFSNEMTLVKSEFHHMPFNGFKTASNKTIQISKEALKKSTRLLDDIYIDIHSIHNEKQTYELENSNPSNKHLCRGEIKDKKEIKTSNVTFANPSKLFSDSDEESELSFPLTPPKSNVFKGVQTTSRKDIKISKEALTETAKTFDNIYKESIEIFENKESNVICPAPKFRFQTANNKPVDISEDAIIASQTLLNSGKPKNSNEFKGFQTASRKDIKISKKALAKSVSIFKNIEEELNDNGFLENVDSSLHYPAPKFQFQTANNKPVEISEDAIIASQTLLNSGKPRNSKELKGFQTASRKDIKISKKALAKSVSIFKNIEEELNDNGFLENVDSSLHYPARKFQFQTANNKPVEISEDAIIASQTLLNSGKPRNSNEFKGFQTASRKDIKISKKALAKSVSIFKNIEEEFNGNGILENVDPSLHYPAPKFQFQTANNKPVEISEDAIIASQTLLNSGKPRNSNEFKGFQTASRKDIKISKKALAKSVSIFKNIEEEFNDNGVLENVDSSLHFPAPKFQFQTANNKLVEISEDAIIASQNLLNSGKPRNLNEFKGFHGILENVDPSLHYPAPKFQFQTANNKPVEISEDAIIASQTLLNFEKPRISNEFKGFQTANKKEIKISKDALARTAKLFDNIDENNSIKENQEFLNLDKQKMQFHTASNKPVEISDELLGVSQCLLNNIKSKLHLKEQNVQRMFQTANNKEVKMSKEALTKTNNIFDRLNFKTDTNKNKAISIVLSQGENCNESDDIKNILDTQVMLNFGETLNTEDFINDRTPHSKRSGSPILSCSKSKKRKFDNTYNNEKDKNKIKSIVIKSSDEKFNFDACYKKNKIYNLSTLKDLEKEFARKGNNTDLSKLNFNTLLQFVFTGNRNELSKKEVSIDHIKDIFLKSVNKKIVPKGWLENHIQLIMWKLFSYEVRFPNCLDKVCSVRNVLDQLKYRYDRELYNVQRPSLRKILEKDDVSSKTLVLCIAEIYVDNKIIKGEIKENDNIELLVTDGWYCIKACIDKLIAKYVAEGKIRVGTKIVTNGAELLNCEQGMSPWEDISSVRLKIFGNSTRPAHWDARLGYNGVAAILSQLSSVKPDGGKVSKLRAYVTRVYPTLYVEKFEDGSTVTRSERLENIYQMKHETERQIALEKIYEEVEKEYMDQDSENMDSWDGDSCKLESGSQIAWMMRTNKDPAEFRANLTESQIRLLQDYTSKNRERQIDMIQEKVRERVRNSGLCAARNVVPLMKIRVAGIENEKKVTKGMLSIWCPSDLIEEVIREGSWIDVYNVVPTAIRYSEIQLSANRQTIFKKSTSKNTISNKITGQLSRQCYLIKDLKNPNLITDYNEVDTVGLVFLIEPTNIAFPTSKALYQNIFLADENKNIICINFWGGLKKFGYENILDTGQIIACVNLQKRSGNIIKNIPQYRATEFSYFTKTPKYECSRKLLNDLVKIFSGLDKRKFCDDCCRIKENNSKLNNSSNISPYRMNNSDYNISKNRAYIESPLVQKDSNLNLTGLDFDSTFKLRDSQELSPNELLRKKRVDEKIAKLKILGDPPPLSSINLINKSIKAGNAFRSPLTSKNEGANVASDKNSDEKENIKSPVLFVNRTYIVRPSVNPVRLNFSTEEANRSDVDPFAEEFDASPPLSFD
ncbi:uncharacterized protein LOC126974694 isoform X3 [Leptidea sinapis]|uniref:uncharacterized protein LOC126974694 isoform X3 n=1 Tax=Leptidea sinapis TaxID=189913 RepID=UPI0021C3F157|nr:uncharacterized protein LOC126974694 isoform X3 [Leptidea sinapis]